MKLIISTVLCTSLTLMLRAQHVIYYDVVPPSHFVAGVYQYPGDMSLHETALDLADLFARAVPGTTYSTALMPATLPTTGILLHIDTNLLATTRLQECEVLCTGPNMITFTASSSYGVHFGVYSYLRDLGFRFYAPGDLWTIIPTLPSAFSATWNGNYRTTVEFHSFAGQGGFGPIPCDPTVSMEPWWLKHNRRANLVHEYDLQGHFGPWVEENSAILSANPCYVAERNNVIPVSGAGVPSIFSSPGIALWAQYGASAYLYPGIYRDPWKRQNISLEPGDGALWGNTTTAGCGVAAWPSASDQQFILADSTIRRLQQMINYPFSATCFAYYEHLDVPSVPIHPLLKVAVTPDGGPSPLTSSAAMRERWRAKHDKIFDYEYLNLPTSAYQGPWTNHDYLHQSCDRILSQGTLGAHYESTYSIFSAALPLYPWNKSLMEGTEYNANHQQMIDQLFPESKAEITELFGYWTTQGHWLDGGSIAENRHHFPHYLWLINEANGRVNTPEERQRIRYLKAYMHFLILQYDLVYLNGLDDNIVGPTEVDAKANELLDYFVKIYNTGIVNSYQGMNFTLSVHCNERTRNRWITYILRTKEVEDPVTGVITIVPDINPATGRQDTVSFEWNSAPFLLLPPITDAEIDYNFDLDISHRPMHGTHIFLSPSEIIAKTCPSGLSRTDQLGHKDSIHVTLSGLRGGDGWYLDATGPANFKINYEMKSALPGSQVNFALDAVAKTYSQEFTIDAAQGTSGTLDFEVPEAGTYVLALSAIDTRVVDVTVITGGLPFYSLRPGFPFSLGDYIHDTLAGPRHIFVPAGVDRVYFAVSGAQGDADLLSTFLIVNPANQRVFPQEAAHDKDVYYFDVPPGQDDRFWRFSTPSGYFYTLINIQNTAFFLQRKRCR